MAAAPAVEIATGRLEGRREDGVLAFRGIPYAAPPTGARRFAAPAPPAPWPGVRDAGRCGPSAPQNPAVLPLPGMDVGPTGEDCLTLNVWTKATDAGRRPVLVWIHGGAFVIGSGSQPIYDGGSLARRGDVVVVTINYRLGPLGFLYLGERCPALADAVASPGLRDQVAALAWVRENVERFGGDPGRVTVFGESAGGMSVGALLGAPSARGLFRRAALQSGACHHVHDRESADRVTGAFLAALGLSPREAEAKLREVPVDKLLAASTQATAALERSVGMLTFQPVVDGELLPEPPLAPVARGERADVELLVGTTRDEWNLLAFLDPQHAELTPAIVLERLREMVGDDAEAVLATYREAWPDASAAALHSAIATDRMFRIPAVRLADAQAAAGGRTFVYRFDWESPALGGRLGACHAVDVPFVFGSAGLEGGEAFVGSGPAVERLTAATQDAWLAFAREGAPAAEELPAWPAHETATRPTLLFDAEPGLAHDPGGATRRAWDGHL